MRKFHIALSVASIDVSVSDYTSRLGKEPDVVIEGQYALWRTETLNLSVKHDPDNVGQMRHLGWEDDNANGFTSELDVNGIEWEHFSAQDQADEMNQIWPGTNFKPKS